ncbi:MAG: 50S ribosomal protein L25/general stress protein Ctc [Flavobacteriaceae bacterium]|nr:50S ribosomal protein L25/general stress protein Ctc [Flavobacteriaceae bacterium]
MKSITINGSTRKVLGKKSTKELRNQEMVPCVLYGEGEPVHFSAKELDFSKLVYTPNAHTVKIVLEKKELDAILQDIQFHPLSDKILHVDFYQLSENKEVSMEIPVKIEGSAPGVLISGGVLILNQRKLKVKALPKNLPDYITADISKLELGDKLYSSELKDEKYEFLHPDNTVVCQVKVARTSLKEIEETEAEVSEETAEGSSEEKKETAEVKEESPSKD